MRKKIGIFLYYFFWLLLMPLFLLVHGFNEYFDLIPFQIGLHLFAQYSLVVLVTYGLIFLIFTPYQKGFLFAFFLLLIYFFFGAFHDFLKALLGDCFFTAYRFLLPALILSIGLVLLYVMKEQKLMGRWALFIKTILVVCVLIECVGIFQKYVSGVSKKNILVPELTLKTGSLKNAPDIFFIVFDEYASSKSLKEDLGFDNSALDSSLRAYHFFIADESRSNYNITPYSLSSTFGMNYLNIGTDTIISANSLLRAVVSVKRTTLIPFLLSNGYHIKNFGCFDFDSAPARTTPYFENYFKDVIDNQTLASRIKRDIWWNIALKNIFTGKPRVPSSFKLSRQVYLDRNVFNFKQVTRELLANSPVPRFVYAHIMLPHEPFFIKADGSLVADTDILGKNIDPRKGYLGQVVYANRLINQLLACSNRSMGRQRVVVIEGDHGYRDFPAPAYKEAFRNLNAYYFSDGDYSRLYRNVSPVNSFRVILNKYFNQKLELLKDSSTYLVDPGQGTPR